MQATQWGYRLLKLLNIPTWVRMPNSKHVAICSEILANLPSQEAEVIIRSYLEAQSEDQIEEVTGYSSAQQREIRQRAKTAFLTRIRGESLKH
jgi:hypothetical protein